MAIEWSPLKTILDQNHRFLLTCHVRPDCDALGSELAMAELLATFGKEVQILNADQTPSRLAFIDPTSRIEVLPREFTAGSQTTGDQAMPDVIVVLDTSVWGQLGAMADFIRESSARVVVLDHHAGNGELDAVMFKDERAEATGRLVYDLACHLGAPISKEMASPLFAAIATDTGWFRFPSTKSSTYRVAGALIEAGAQPSEIFRQLYEQDSLQRAQLRSVALANITLELEGRLAHTYLLKSDFDQTGATRSETEDFINMTMVIDGTEVAVMLTEQADGQFKLSLRTRSDVNCAKIAATFGGGGHQKAAGATIKGTLKKVQSSVLDAVRAAMVT